MQLNIVLSPSYFLLLHGFLLVSCDIVEFEKFVPPAGPWGRQPVLLDEDGGYTNLLIAIHIDVEESLSVIEDIKDIFTLTSQMLYEASDQALYFREISILVPDNWDDSIEYEKSRPNETFQTARVIIRNEKSKGSPPSYPFVRQLGGREVEAEYMYLPSGLFRPFNETGKNKNADKILNLWGRLRWGLVETNTEISKQLSSSLTLQDTTWEDCMRNSVDFQSSRDVQTTNNTNVIPMYRVLRRRDVLSVVVLDARENMKENDKFERMKEAFENYVWNLFPAYSWVGVVVVRDKSKMLLPVVKLWESPGFRNNSMIRKLPETTNGNSSLGKGLIKAKEMLSQKRQDISNCFIFIMSDGTDDIPPTVNEVRQEVASGGVVIATLPFSTNSSENIFMNNTINQNFTVKNTNQLYRLEDEKRYLRIFQSSEVALLPYQWKRFDFPMDNDSHMDSVIVRVRVDNSTDRLDYQYFYEINSAPRDCFFNVINVSSDDSKVTDVIIYTHAIQGFKILSNISQMVSFEVFSAITLSFDNEIAYIDEAIRTRSFLKSKEVNFDLTGVPLYVSVTKNENPVLNVSSVTAIITSPDGVDSRIQLLDEGKGADEQFLDGIYSNHFTNFTIEGKYTVEFQVLSGQGSCIQNFLPEELTRTLPELEPEVCNTFYSSPLAPFLRFPPPLSFTVSGIPPNTVSDVRAEVDESKRIVKLSWATAGEDLAIGRANNYEIRYGSVPLDIANNFDGATDVSECSDEDKNSTHADFPQREFFCGSFSRVEGEVFGIAIRAIDSHGNKGNVSDVITVVFPVQLMTTTQPTSTKEISVSIMNKIMQNKLLIATLMLSVVVSAAVLYIARKKYLRREKMETKVFRPSPNVGRNYLTPSPSLCPSRSTCTPEVIIIEDIYKRRYLVSR